MPDHWWGPLAVWKGGLGIWGGIAPAPSRASGACAARASTSRASWMPPRPGLLVAQSIGRVGNWFNQELFGAPHLPPVGTRDRSRAPPGPLRAVSDLPPDLPLRDRLEPVLAAFLVWLGHRRGIRPPGLFALYVTGYSAFRILEEPLRVDPAHHILGLRLNFFVAAVLTLAGAAWFLRTQRTNRPPDPRPSDAAPERSP